jgi:ubiquinone/menaquinone biosynthesis C-methylase UbiE
MKAYWTGTANDIRNVVKMNCRPCRWSFLFKYLAGKSKSVKILDIGCGTGNKMLSLLDAGYRNTVGVEYNPEVYRQMVERYHQLKISEGNAEDLKNFGNNSFDLVYCSHVLEHLPYPEKAIKEARRVLKKGGAYIIGIPNGDHLNDKTLRIIQMVFYGNYDHLQRFNLRKISEILKQNSFNVVKISARKGSFQILLDHRIKFRQLSQRLYKFLRRIYWKDLSFDILAIKI